VQEDAAVRRGEWGTSVGLELAGRTLGIVGFGRLGSAVARVALAFDMNVLAWSRSLTPERAAAAGVEAASLDDVLTRSDMVSIHLALTPQTRGLIGARELALMKPEAVLVN